MENVIDDGIKKLLVHLTLYKKHNFPSKKTVPKQTKAYVIKRIIKPTFIPAIVR